MDLITPPKILVLHGDGINCEGETKKALEAAGANVVLKTIKDLTEDQRALELSQAMIIPGGFSFGDELASGRVLALKIKYQLGEKFYDYAKKNPILGICNGFQVLVEMGLLPNSEKKEKKLSLTHNSHGKFINKWVSIKHHPTPCIFTKELSAREFLLPVRHAEGRVFTNALDELFAKNQIPLCYNEDINGSMGNIAGICNETGTIFGLMPHPEAASFLEQLPSKQSPIGIEIFHNLLNYLLF